MKRILIGVQESTKIAFDFSSIHTFFLFRPMYHLLGNEYDLNVQQYPKCIFCKYCHETDGVIVFLLKSLVNHFSYTFDKPTNC